jgi:hypothetical protein
VLPPLLVPKIINPFWREEVWHVTDPDPDTHETAVSGSPSVVK